MMSTNGIAGTWSPAVVNTLVGATYTFTPNAGQCATNTTMLITVIPAVTPTFNLIPPFCEGGTAPVLPTTSLNGITGTWNPSVVSNAASGVYTFTPNVGQCATPTTLPVLVVPQPTLFLGNDTLVCNANSLVLDATSPIPLTTYLWNTGATSPTITVTAPGTYSVVTTNPIGCTATDSRNVAFGNSPQFSIGRDTVICPSQNIVLNTNITDPALGILWQDGSTGATFTVTQPGTYYADVTNNCGTTRKTVVVTKGVCKILVPNVFTPNNDGKNDVFKVGGGESVTNFHMRVFNRFGQILFESKQVQKGWDGRYDGVKQDVGAYIYYVIYTDPITGKVYNLKGTVMLVR
jgi:gliding motility-associated-like protein